MAAPILVFLAATLLYAGTLAAGFTNWDDPIVVLENPDLPLRTAEQWRSLLVMPRLGSITPLTNLSYALDHRIWGLNAAGYHFSNILLQGICAVLLWYLVRRMSDRPRAATLSALLFAVHPVGTEVAAWIAERKTLLSAAFMLAALLAYLRAEGRSAGRWAAACVSLFALGCASKVAIVPFPFVFLALHWGYRVPMTRARVAACLGSLLIAITAGLAMLHAHAGIMKTYGLFGGSIPEHATVIARTFGRYVLKLLFPVRLSPIYDFRPGPQAVTPLAILGALLAAIALCAVLWAIRRRGPGAFWACAAILLWLPASSILVPISVPMTDHFLYLSLIFLAPLVAIPIERRAAGPDGRRVLAIFAAALFCMASLSVRQATHWRSSLDLWNHAVGVEPRNPWAHRMLALTHYEEKRPAEAVREARAALEALPRSLEIRELLANAALEAGDYETAENAFRAELGVFPGAVSALLGVARVQAARGEDRKALETYLEVLRKMQDYPAAAEGLVKLAREKSLEREALAGLPRAPTSAPMELARGDLLLALGRRAEAAEVWRKLLLTRPDFAPARERLRALRTPPR